MSDQKINRMREVDQNQMLFLAKQRFVNGYDTVTLLKIAQSDFEKKQVILIALLDVDEKQLNAVMNDIQDEDPHLMDDYHQLKTMLKKIHPLQTLPKPPKSDLP